MKYVTEALLLFTVTLVISQKSEDEKRAYEFGFTIDGQQHRHEKKDDKGIIQGEFGFVTADGIYHVTVYATDENGNFKILSMKNLRVSAPLDGSPLTGPISPEAGKYFKVAPQQGQLAQAQKAVAQPEPLSIPEQPVGPPQISQQQPQQPLVTTQRPKINYPFTTQPTIKPACAGCGYVTTAKSVPGQPFPFQNPTFKKQNSQTSQFNSQNSINQQGGGQPQRQYPNEQSGFGGQNGGQIGGSEGFNAQVPGNNLLPPGVSPQNQQNVQVSNQKNRSQFDSANNQQLTQGQGGQYPSGQPNLNPSGIPEQGQPGQQQQNPQGYQQNQQVYQQQGYQQSQQQNANDQQLAQGQGEKYPSGQPNPNPLGINVPEEGQQGYQQQNQQENQQGYRQQGYQQSGFGPAQQNEDKYSTLPPVAVKDNVINVGGKNPQQIPIKDKFPGMQDGLPEGIEEKDIKDLLYKFHYTVGFHGHYEKGLKNGAKIGGYFVNGRDGISRVVTYVADENGYRAKTKLINLGLDSDETPKEETEKTFGLKSFEFVWYPIE